MKKKKRRKTEGNDPWTVCTYSRICMYNNYIISVNSTCTFSIQYVYINIYDSFLFKMIVIETLTYFEWILINYMISKPMVVNYIYYDLKYLCHACTNTFNAHVGLLECYFLPFMWTGFYFQPSLWKKLKLNMIIR